MVAELPEDKIIKIIQFIESLLNKNRCTKRELLQLLGHLIFASRVILPGKSFKSYLISLSTTVKNLHHLVYLNSYCQQDLHMFLRNWNGVSLFHEPCFKHAPHMDASLIGFRAFFQNHWFCSEWPACLPSVQDGDLSMAFRELHPLVAAAVV